MTLSTSIHVAVIEHQTGMDVFTDLTESDLTSQVLAYCWSHWETVNHPGFVEEPDDAGEAVELYFKDHLDDTLSTHCCVLPAPKSESDWVRITNKREDTFREARRPHPKFDEGPTNNAGMRPADPLLGICF